jgi:long-chain acyl-CoA synthetase
VVTLYATLGDEAIVHGINETEATMVVTTQDLLPKFKMLLKQCPSIKVLVYMQDQLASRNSQGLTDGFPSDIKIITFNDVVHSGAAASHIESNPPGPDDTAIIMYTSGSTGVPKGVLLTHRNMMTTVRSFSDAVDIYHDDIFMGYLPLAHVFELLSGELP